MHAGDSLSIPDAKTMPYGLVAFARESDAPTFLPKITADAVQSTNNKIRRRRRSLKQFFAARPNLERDQEAEVPAVPSLPDLVHSPSEISTVASDSPISYMSSIRRQASTEVPDRHSDEKLQARAAMDGSGSNDAITIAASVRALGMKNLDAHSANGKNSREAVPLQTLAAPGIAAELLPDSQETMAQDDQVRNDEMLLPNDSSRPSLRKSASWPAELAALAVPQTELDTLADDDEDKPLGARALARHSVLIPARKLDHAPQLNLAVDTSHSPIDNSLRLPRLSPPPVSPTCSVSSSSSSSGNSGPLHSAQTISSSGSPRSLCFGARICLELTLSKLRCESPNSGNPILLPERLNTPGGRPYPSSTAALGKARKEGKGTLASALGRTRMLRRLEGRRLTLLEQVELDGFRKPTPTSPAATSPATILARSSSVLPSYRAVANIASRALALALGDDKYAVPSTTVAAVVLSRPPSKTSQRSTTACPAESFQQLQEAAWKRWTNRPAFTARCTIYLCDGQCADIQPKQQPIVLSDRAKCNAGINDFSGVMPQWTRQEGRNSVPHSMSQIAQADRHNRQSHIANKSCPLSVRRASGALTTHLGYRKPGDGASTAKAVPAAITCTRDLPPTSTSLDRMSGGSGDQAGTSPGHDRSLQLKQNRPLLPSPSLHEAAPQKERMLLKMRESSPAAESESDLEPASRQEGAAKKLEKRTSLFSRAFGQSSSSRKSTLAAVANTQSVMGGVRIQEGHNNRQDESKARPPREQPPPRSRSKHSALSPYESFVSLQSSSESSAPPHRARAVSSPSDSSRRHTVLLSHAEPLPARAPHLQRPMSQIVQLPASSSEPNLFQPLQRASSARLRIHPHVRDASTPTAPNLRGAVQPMPSSLVPRSALRTVRQPSPLPANEDDEDLPLVVVRAKAKRQSIASNAPAKPARIVSFHEEAAPVPRPITHRQSSLPAAAYGDRLPHVGASNRRSMLAYNERPVSLALSDYAAEELQRLQSEVLVLRKQQKEAEGMKREYEALKVAENRGSQMGYVENWDALKQKQEEEAQKRKVCT